MRICITLKIYVTSSKTHIIFFLLQIHERQHTGVKPYECRACNHKFTNWPNYNKHMKRKHDTVNVIEKGDELILLKI